MKYRRPFLITTLVIPLLLLFTSMAVAADISGKTTNINNSFTFDVTGNKNANNTGTNLPADTNIPTYSDSANVFQNQVKIDGLGIIINGIGNIYGGYTHGTGDADENDVIITDAIVNGSAALWIVGGYTRQGNATKNKVFVDVTGTVGGTVYGAIGFGNVTHNDIEIKGTAKNVYGGWSQSDGNVTDNKIKISGTAGRVYGGHAKGDGNVIDNKIEISGSGTADRVSGGLANGDGNVADNTIEISGTVNDDVIGGETTGDGNVTDNKIEISGTAGRAYGGVANGDGNVADNTIEISGTTNWVTGGLANGDANVTGNKIEISGTVNNNVVGGSTSGTGDIANNTIEISGTVNNDVYAGVTTGDSNITDNKIEISGTANKVFGGRTYGDGDITDNTIEISGTVNNNVVGGITSGTGDIANNTIEISGTVTGLVLSGYTSGTGTIKDNTITILDTANLASAEVFACNSGVNSAGNTLNIKGFSGDVLSIGNFDTYNFEIGVLAANNTFINITGIDPVTLLNNYVDIDGAVINIDFALAFMSNPLSASDVITVISHINASATPASVTVMASPFVAFDYIATYDTGALLLKVFNTGLLPQTEALAEGFAASLAFLGQAADMRSGINFVPQDSRFIPFAKMVYSKQYISTGSSVNVKGFSALAGLALNTNFDNRSQLVVGAFIEGGWGNYDSRNSFSNSASVKGKGDTEYYGGGILARYAMASGLYGEGTFAAGKTETDFKSWDFTPGTKTKYDSSVPYYSAHLGLGKIFNMCDIFNLDVYGKYLWTRQAGDNVTVDGYRFKFKDTDSHRLRAGGKLQSTALPQFQPYAGAAFEYEFSGKVKGSLSGMNLGQPSLRGGTGIGELGLVWSPTESGNLKVDLGAQGYVGKREGVSGGLTVTMSF